MNADEARFAELYPEHAKLQDKMPVRDAAQDFLDWLLDETNMCICEESDLHGFVVEDGEHHELGAVMFPTMRSRESILAEFLGIDPKALEKEKQTMLELVRGQLGV